MKFKTIHNELSYNKIRTIHKHVLVRSNQTPKLRSIIEQASRGTAPTGIKFATLANDGFIPPQYSREDITSLHNRYKNLLAERSALEQLAKDIPKDTPKDIPKDTPMDTPKV